MGIPSILVWNYVSGQGVRRERPGVPNLSLSPHSPMNNLVDRLAVHRVDGDGSAATPGRTDLPAGPARSGAARPGPAADGTA